MPTSPIARRPVCSSFCRCPRLWLLFVACSLLVHRGSMAAANDPEQAAPALAATGTLHVAAVRQPIYGFGGSQTYNGDPLIGFANREAVYRALFSELKLDILRLRNYYDYDGQEEGF